MRNALLSAHLPAPYPDPEAYRKAYAQIYGVDEYFHGGDDWREARIPRGLPAAAVYRRLPAAPGFEYGGYLTRTRIRYTEGWATSADILACKPCTWHSHPLDHPHADLPSDRDLYAFVRYRNLRHITVGRSIIWVFDKTAATLRTVKRLNAWEGRNLVRAVLEVGSDDYPALALRKLGFRVPRSLREYGRVWPRLVAEALRIRVTVLESHRNQP